MRNDDGRVTGPDGRPLPGEYAVGWIKRGPSGVIGTNKKCATETVAHIVSDELRMPPIDDDVDPWLRERLPNLVTWAGWLAIDDAERAAGEPAGRPRVKLVRLENMHEVADGASVGG